MEDLSTMTRNWHGRLPSPYTVT